MSTSTHDKYRALRDALVTAPDYMALPPRERAACTRFCGMVPDLGTDRSPPALEIKTAYKQALGEARGLVAEGRLAVNLDGEGPVEVSDTERPPPTEGPDDTTAREDPAPEPSTPENVEPTATGGGDQEDTLALFHALVARGAKYEEYPIHPAADLFPLMAGQAMVDFEEHVGVHGLIEPIVVHREQLIEGRNRLSACLKKGVEPRFVAWDGTGSVAEWIVAKNLHRRHLSDQQRAMVASKLAEVLAAEGRARRAENLRQTPGILEGANLPHREEGRSAERAAEMVNVSPTAVKKAARVRRTGDETLVAAVAAGNVSLDAAVQVAEMPKEEQKEIVKKGKVKEAAKRIRKQKAAGKPKPKPKAKKKAPEPTEPADDQADTPDAPEPDQATEDDDPLLVEVHAAVDEVAKEARQAGRLDEVTPTLELVARGFRFRAQRLRDGLPLK